MLSTLSLILAALSVGQVSGLDAARLARWDAAIVAEARHASDAAALANRFSGTVLVARGDLVLFEKAYGLADREAGVANELDTKFNVGSMNKMMTAIAIAQLEQAGKLSFQDQLGKYLPDYPNPEARAVTIHQLLTHTGGIGDFLGDAFAKSRDGLRTTKDFLPLFADKPLKFAPGTKWAYSNGGYIVLGLIIEKVSGQPYEEYVRDHILSPAQMRDTGFYALDAFVEKRAKGYTRLGPNGEKDRRLKWDSASRNLVKGCAAGGGFSTTPDLYRFARALVAGKLLDPAHTALVCEGKVAVSPKKTDKLYGYGFFDFWTRGVRHYGHGGAMYGVNGDLHIFPDYGYVVIALSNFDPPSAQKLAGKIVDAVVGQVR